MKMTDRKILIEVTEEEYEILKKGITLAEMKTEDLICEIMSRSMDKHISDSGGRGVLTGSASVEGSVPTTDGVFYFKNAQSIIRPSRISAVLDPLDHSNPASPLISDILSDYFGKGGKK